MKKIFVMMIIASLFAACKQSGPTGENKDLAKVFGDYYQDRLSSTR
jgi:hypothetical protein